MNDTSTVSEKLIRLVDKTKKSIFREQVRIFVKHKFKVQTVNIQQHLIVIE